MNFLRGNYVIFTQQIKYAAQAFEFNPDISAQTLIALKCHFDGVNQSFVNQNVALGLTVTSVENPIEDYTVLPLSWDTVKVVCYGSSAIRLRIYGIEYDTCNADYTSPMPIGEIPEPEPGIVAMDEPLSGDYGVSPPYDAETDDGGDTLPYGDDEPPPPEGEGDPCQLLDIVWRGAINEPGNFTDPRTNRVFGVFTGIRVSPTNADNIEIGCQGVKPKAGVPVSTEVCLTSAAYYVVDTVGGGWAEVELLAVNPVP